jgi:Tol biopolymer transport system component
MYAARRRRTLWAERIVMRRILDVVVVTAVIGVSVLLGYDGAGGAPAASPSATPLSGAAVFASDLGIYVANLDGTGVKRLTRDGYDADPVWSPDAKRIAFSRMTGWSTTVMVMNADGGGLRRLGWGEGPAWSPDGTRIAYVDGPGIVDVSSGKTIAPAPAGFTIARLAGSGARRAGVGEVFSLSWSPDGKQIAYTVRRDGWIRLHDVRTGKATKLALVPGGAHDLEWSPDGTQIAAHDDKGIELVDVSTRRVSTLTGDGRHPLWSPDGTRIAFVRYDAERDIARLLTIGRDGRGRRQLVAEMAGWTVSWSGDGRGLLFSKSRSAGEGADIWWIRADGRGRQRITHAFPTGASFSAPQWAPTTLPPRTAALVPAISLVPRTVATPAPVLRLAADASRVVFETTCYGGPLTIWDTTGALDRVVGEDCDTENGREELALAAGRIAWINENYSMIYRFLELATPGKKPAHVDDADAKHDGGWIGNLMGDAGLLVYNKWRVTHSGDIADPRWRVEDPGLWRIDGTRPTRIVAGADAFDLVDVDTGRIAVLREDGKLVILDRQGKRLSAFSLGKRGVEAEPSTGRWPVRLTEGLVVVLRGTAIEARDAVSGTVRHRWPTASSEAPLTLEAARGDFVVYKTGIALHLLRLSDGRDRIVEIPDEEGPVHAELERAGLYFSYNTPVGAKHGRVAFVPLRELTARFAAS